MKVFHSVIYKYIFFGMYKNITIYMLFYKCFFFMSSDRVQNVRGQGKRFSCRWRRRSLRDHYHPYIMSSRGLIHHALPCGFHTPCSRILFHFLLLLLSHPSHFHAVSRTRASRPFSFLIFFCLLWCRRLLLPSLSPFSRSLLYLPWEKGRWW